MAVNTAALGRLSSAASGLMERISITLTFIWSVLTYSLTNGVIAPSRRFVVSIERGRVSVLHGSRFLSKMRIRGFRVYTFEEDKYVQPESLASTLSLAIKEFKARRSEVTLILPRSWVIVRTTDLPASVKENISDVVGYELDRLTPFSSDNAYYDFRVLGEAEGRLSLILVAVKADTVDRYLEAFKEEGVVVSKATIDLSSMGTLCSYLSEGGDSICLDVDSLGYEGALIHNYSLSDTFGGTFRERDSDGRMSLMADTLKPFLDEARNHGVSPIVTLFSEGLEHAARLERFVGVPVKVMQDKDIKHRFPTKREGLSGTAVGGMLESLWPKAHGINVLSKGVYRKERKSYFVTSLLILLLLAACVPFFVLPLQREQHRLDEINRQIALRKEGVKKVEALRKQVKAAGDEIALINDFKQTRPAALVLLKELTTILPKEVWLTRVKTTDTTVDLEGYARSASEILPKLEQSKYLKKVEFASPTIKDVRMDAERFVIKSEVEGFAKEEEKGKDGKKK
jgi:Tfp pilus assembly protein PilN